MSKISDIRELIESENKRVSERFTVLCTFQGFLFASLSLEPAKSLVFQSIKPYLVIVGAVSALSIGWLLFLAQDAIRLLLKQYKKIPNYIREDEGPVIGVLADDLDGRGYWFGRFTDPTFILPCCLVVIWTIIFFHVL